MKLGALIAAIAAGSIGAVIWALIAHFANMEVGYVAWGIGLLVGYSAHALGAEGTVAGVLCALIAVASMLGGKAVAATMTIDSIIAEQFQNVFEYTKADAPFFADIDSPEAVRKFMVDYQYTEAETPESIGDEELQAFQADSAIHLTSFRDQQPTYDDWAKSPHASSVEDAIREQISLVDAVKNSLGLFDVIFGLLGISTAFRMGSAKQDDDEFDLAPMTEVPAAVPQHSADQPDVKGHDDLTNS